MTPTEQFCRILRQRSAEHTSAGQLLFDNGLYGQMVSVLRMELDSMVRTIFLLNDPLDARAHFIAQTLRNEKWSRPNSRATITDRQMVDLANNLNGWSNSVYRLGCAFIHLSPMSDYTNAEPFQHLSQFEKDHIKRHLHYYHGFPLSDPINMTTVSPYLLRVLEKVSSNLHYYIELLESQWIGNGSEL